MTVLEYLLILTGLTYCIGAPSPEKDCGPPPRFTDRELQGTTWDEESYKPDTKALYTCRPGFIRLGSTQYLCSEGKWKSLGVVGQCKKRSCGHPGDIDFGTFELKNEEEFVFGAIVEYTCNEGYQMISKHRTRECTATGWTKYRPECEVRFCPLVQVNPNVNLITTSYDEEYSVGQVIRFECKNANQKLNGVSEIFCTSEGMWNAPTPTCEDVSCSLPSINHGKVSNTKALYKDKDTTEYSCDPGYKASTLTLLACTKNGWRPNPLCEEIVCYQETVKNGIAHFTKDTYKEGNTVVFTCNEGYQIEHKPEEPRTCTMNGWSPPLNCISKKCSKPQVINGYINGEYGFPLSPGRYIYYNCNSGFLSARKYDYNNYVYCRKTGWEADPVCYRRCQNPTENYLNAKISHTNDYHTYTEGDILNIRCYQGYTTLDGEQTGKITCLPNGVFTGDKCDKICRKPDVHNGEFRTDKDVFVFGDSLPYTCEEGFVSGNNNNRDEDTTQCSEGGWYPKPECKEIECGIQIDKKERKYKYGTVIHFTCKQDWELEGPKSIQCFYYGWSSDSPVCKSPKNKYSGAIFSNKPTGSNCSSISAPPNARFIKGIKDEYLNGDKIEIACSYGYLLVGSENILCRDGKWQSPPRCIKRTRCSDSPPTILQGKISEDTISEEYYTGDKVKYICSDGYHITGSDEISCMNGKWQRQPTCEGKSCGNPLQIENGEPKEALREYKHGERAAYQCSQNYKLSKFEDAVCLRGKWERVPTCTYSSCKNPPTIRHGKFLGNIKSTYLSGEKVTYSCIEGYTLGLSANAITCQDSLWTEPPECKIVGQQCLSPPVVQYGEITEQKRMSYQSDSTVHYKCANFHILEGNPTIKCKDGEWEKEPVCRVPCTVREIDMQQNNIQFLYKYGDDKTRKLYSVHADSMSFECKSGYKIPDTKRLRIQCLDGKLKYPKCFKDGYCVLKQEEMSANNIRYNKSNAIDAWNNEIDNGQTIEFECEEGTRPENGLKGTCINQKFNYPKCLAGLSCPPPNISNARPGKQESYESGSSVEIQCEDTYVLNGLLRVACEDGKWSELPQCFKPCRVDITRLDAYHIELRDNPPGIFPHGDVNVRCKNSFKRPGPLITSCYDGTMKYMRCFSGGTCRIDENKMDENFLELDEVHDNERYYEEGETVTFKCKAGFSNTIGLAETCTKSGDKPAEYTLNYPTCAQVSAV